MVVVELGWDWDWLGRRSSEMGFGVLEESLEKSLFIDGALGR